MALETREIIFTEREITAAIVLYAAQTGRTKLGVTSPKNIEIKGFDEVHATFSLENSNEKIVLSTADILSALISFCIQCRIPLPKSAPKTLRRMGDQVALVINNWRFQTPAPRYAA